MYRSNAEVYRNSAIPYLSIWKQGNIEPLNLEKFLSTYKKEGLYLCHLILLYSIIFERMVEEEEKLEAWTFQNGQDLREDNKNIM